MSKIDVGMSIFCFVVRKEDCVCEREKNEWGREDTERYRESNRKKVRKREKLRERKLEKEREEKERERTCFALFTRIKCGYLYVMSKDSGFLGWKKKEIFISPT